jgi:hypothetical protein
MHPHAKAVTHMAGDSSLEHRVKVEFYEWCERAGVGVMACMQVLDVHQYGFRLRACVVLALKEPHPHVMGVVVDDDQAVAEAMRGGDIKWTLEVKRTG